MKYLLDTHTWFWAVENPEKIPDRSLAVLKDGASLPFGLSAISLWELAKLVAKERIILTIPLEEWMNRALNPQFIRILPISPQVAINSTKLPGIFHNDPADQIIVATCRLENVELITADKAILAYQHVKAVWN